MVLRTRRKRLAEAINLVKLTILQGAIDHGVLDESPALSQAGINVLSREFREFKSLLFANEWVCRASEIGMAYGCCVRSTVKCRPNMVNGSRFGFLENDRRAVRASGVCGPTRKGRATNNRRRKANCTSFTK